MTTFMLCSTITIVLSPCCADFGDDLHQFRHLLGRHARRRFVEQQQFGVGGQQNRQFELAFAAVRQHVGGHAAPSRAGRAGPACPARGGCSRLNESARRQKRKLTPSQRLRRQPDVFQHGQVRENVGDLERAPDALVRAPMDGQMR